MRKRSSCDSGKAKVPPELTGFCVAITKKGSGKGRVAPSMVTWPSSIASSRALWLFGVARLISSASTSSAKIGPGWNTNWPLSLSNTEVPRMSPGNRSEVNWMRWNSSPNICARAWLSVVLPMPGRSSTSRCPRASRQVSASRTCGSLPSTIWLTPARQASSFARMKYPFPSQSGDPTGAPTARQATAIFTDKACEPGLAWKATR